MRLAKANDIGLDTIQAMRGQMNVWNRAQIEYLDHIPTLISEGKLNGDIIAVGATAGHTPFEVLMRLVHGHSNDELVQWKKAGYNAWQMRNYHTMKDSGELAKIQELVQD